MPMAWKPWRVCWTFQQTLPSKIWPFSLAAHQLLSWLWKHSKGMIQYNVILKFQLKHSRDTIKDLCNIVVCWIYRWKFDLSDWVCNILNKNLPFKKLWRWIQIKVWHSNGFYFPHVSSHCPLCSLQVRKKKKKNEFNCIWNLKYILRQSFLQGWFSNRHWKAMPLSNLYLFYYNRKLKLKIDWNKLRELCSIKRSTYDKLVAEMEIHAVKLLGKQLNILILPI